MHSVVIIVSKTIIYLKVAKRVDFKWSHHRKDMVIM